MSVVTLVPVIRRSPPLVILITSWVTPLAHYCPLLSKVAYLVTNFMKVTLRGSKPNVNAHFFIPLSSLANNDLEGNTSRTQPSIGPAQRESDRRILTPLEKRAHTLPVRNRGYYYVFTPPRLRPVTETFARVIPRAPSA